MDRDSGFVRHVSDRGFGFIAAVPPNGDGLK